MKYNLRIEDTVTALNEFSKLNGMEGVFVSSKKANKASAFTNAIKEFVVELWYMHSPSSEQGFKKESMFKVTIASRTLNEDEELKVWNELGIAFQLNIMQFITDGRWKSLL